MSDLNTSPQPDADSSDSASNTNFIEQLLRDDPNKKRHVIFPIQYPDIWAAYKKHESAIWHAHEIKLTPDLTDWEKLSDNEKHFVKTVLAFFASADGIVSENLAQRFYNDIKVPEARCFYGFQIMMENVHCVAPETMILTSKGYFEIQHLVGQNVHVWNGLDFSETVIRLTSEKPVKLIKVCLSNGQYVECTEDHKWIIDGSEQRILAKDLKTGDAIVAYNLPLITVGEDIKNAYRLGCEFAARLININETNRTSSHAEIPLNASLSGRIEWLSGFIDTRIMHSTGEQHIDKNIICSFKGPKNAIKKIQLMIQTCGIQSVSEHTDTHSNLHLSKNNIVELKKLGLRCRNFKLTVNTTVSPSQSSPPGGAMQSLSPTPDNIICVTEVIDNNRFSPTYCFNVPTYHKGIFNGIMTGQSEVYSKLIDTYIKDSDEKHRLFNAVDNVPCIRKKANWAMNWITSEDSYAKRLVAFAIIEGVFFSGSFCCIYWLQERKLLPALGKANDFIARDEGMHTDFAVLIYKMLERKLNQEEIAIIFVEAVDIEIEFITEALPCTLLGISPDNMKQYIKFVADRLIVQLGHAPIYNTTNPFPFMNAIAIRNKSNFFEHDPTEYSKPSEAENTNDESAYDDL